MTWIQTITDRAFDTLNPTAEQVSTEEIARVLPRVPRWNAHSSFPISVGDHCLRVRRIVKGWGGTELEQRIALAHDFHEAYIGDLPSPIKAAYPSLKELDRKAWVAVAEALDLPVEMPKIVKQADLQALRDERLVALGDAPQSWGIPGFDDMPASDVPVVPRARASVEMALRALMVRYGWLGCLS